MLAVCIKYFNLELREDTKRIMKQGKSYMKVRQADGSKT